MPKQPRITALEAEKMLLKGGFELNRTKGSHRIFLKGNVRIVVPFHSGQILHPKIVREVLEALS